MPTPSQTAQQNKGRINHLAGLAAEQSIAYHYVKRGFELVAQRFKSAVGEIDLIFRDLKGGLVFVEVKKSKSIAQAAQRLTQAQLHRIYQTAEFFMASDPKGLMQSARIDVGLVDHMGRYEVIENAYCA